MGPYGSIFLFKATKSLIKPLGIYFFKKELIKPACYEKKMIFDESGVKNVPEEE